METNDERKWCVYIHRNKINNKAYIGITSDDIKKRWKYGHGYKHNPYFNAAIKKYGWDNFEHIIWAENLTEKKAKEWEIRLIALFKTNCCRYRNPEYGYNMTDGGEGCLGRQMSEENKKKISEIMKERLKDPKNHPMYGKHCSEETKKKLSESHKGKFPSIETRAKLSESRKGERKPNYGKPMSDERKKKQSQTMKGRYCGENNPNYGNHKLAGKNHPNYGKKMSEEQRKKMSKAAQGKYVGENNPKARKVIRLSDLKIYGYITEAAQDEGINRNAMRERCKKHKDFMYYDEWIIQQKDLTNSENSDILTKQND